MVLGVPLFKYIRVVGFIWRSLKFLSSFFQLCPGSMAMILLVKGTSHDSTSIDMTSSTKLG